LSELDLRCPACKTNLKSEGNKLICAKKNCLHSFPGEGFHVSNNKPILISKKLTDTLVDPNTVISPIKRKITFLKAISDAFTIPNKTQAQNVEKFIIKLDLNEKVPKKVLIIGSGTESLEIKKLRKKIGIKLVGFDIYDSNNVDFIADAHYLPIESNSFDGVWVQAVLEHVMEPIEVVNEIHRVLKNDGIVYAETPFMQQVHEGAYDYTRYSVLGHRFLFKKFEQISIGGLKGPTEVLAWSLKYLVWSITRSKFLSIIVGQVIALILSPLELLVSKSAEYDCFSGVYFMGRKSSEFKEISHKDIPPLYKGML